jgi:HAD superfamily hydrolase (TIGR01509 family)
VSSVVKACLVDVYDTILHSAFAERMSALAQALEISPDIWLAEWEKTREDRDRGKLTIAASFDVALRGLGLDPESDAVADFVRRDAEFSRTHARLFDDTVPFLTWLRSQDVLIALVSNCTESTRGLLEYLGISPLADEVILSCEVGSIKPYPEIYVTALAELGVAAGDAVFIDDQPQFCVGAEALGIRAIQIARDAPDDYVSQWGFPVVHSLLDVKPLL